MKMNRILKKALILLLIIAGCELTTARAQVIIDLEQNGKVRPKTQDDYLQEDRALRERLKADSIAYVDHLTRAFNALHRDSLDQAEQLLLGCLKLRPSAPSNHIVKHYLGKIEMARGDFNKAAQQFTSLLKEQPTDREVRIDRAACYFEQNSLKAALDDCQTLLQSELNDEVRTRALFLQSAVHRSLRQPDLALKDLEKVLEADPQNESALLLSALCLEDLGRPAEALNQLNLFVASHPKSVNGLAARAELEIRQGLLTLARADYDSALRLAPEDGSLYVARATLLLKLKLPSAARKDLDKAVELGFSHASLEHLYRQTLQK